MSLNKSEYESKYFQALKPPLMCWDCCCTTHRERDISDFRVGGFQKQSLIDYPGRISAIVFTSGCNFRCGYCHNPGLVIPEQIKKSQNVDVPELLDWIRKHKKLLDAVVVTGGEPTLHNQLPDFLDIIKNMNLEVKLDTNGTNPEMLQELIDYHLVDYVAMDLKAPLVYSRYREIAGHLFSELMFEKVCDSVKILKKKNISHEFRTTLAPQLSIRDLSAIADVADTRYFIQFLRSPGTNLLEQGTVSPEAVRNMVSNHSKSEIIGVR